MEISIQEIDVSIKDVFKETEVLSTSTVYEKTDDINELKLVIFMNKVFYAKTNILYTKLIFRVDKEKKKLTKNFFTYLYDINCVYKQIDFTDLEDFKNKLTKIFKNNKFGDDIKTLSKFLRTPSIDINEWLNKNNVRDLSVYGFKYDPQIKIIPCKILNFNFSINISNIYQIDLNIVKEENDIYYYNFKILDETFTVERNNLKDISELIAHTLKNKLSK